MMSQIELWNMQEACSRRNEMRERREKRSYSLISLVILILGVVLSALSAMLTLYVLKMSVTMTGSGFLIIGIAGITFGIAAVFFARILR